MWRALLAGFSSRRTNVALLALLPIAALTGILAFAVGTPRPARAVMIAHGIAGVGVLLLSPRKSMIVRRGLRRTMLRTAGVVSGAGLLWLSAEAAWTLGGTRGAQRRFTGSHERGSLNPARMPVTQWMFDRVPQVPAEQGRLRVVTAAPAVSYRLADLPDGDRVRATLDCTGGWHAEQHWSGVPLDRLIGEAGLAREARSVLVRSVTGYGRRFPVSDLPRLWLATHYGGRPLARGHGAPARLVAPGRRGFWWVKWVDLVAVDDVPAWRQPPFPLQ
ncbi:MAG: molybdopterin-dependent oxidoreductase [Nitriliruptorales bacterium]|nr:molybdopterin-dependent oxidoreductase [Nitriliruptorales bacterium]